MGDGDVRSISVTSNWPNSLQMARTVDIGVGWQPGVVYYKYGINAQFAYASLVSVWHRFGIYG